MTQDELSNGYGDLLINGEDALTQYGATMGDGFLDALTAPPSPKDPITNDVRTEHGTRYADRDTVRYKARDITLTFRLYGSTAEELQERRSRFYATIAEPIELQVRGDSNIYRLRYAGYSSAYGMNTSRTSVAIPLRFTEADPTDRQ
jgi:hypothetical protein